MFRLSFVLAAACALVASAAQAQPHNLIIFVADGLRSRIVTETTAPALAAVRREGVDFRNSHSLYPTITTPNSSAIATGHYLGDSGDFGNTIFVGEPLPGHRSGITEIENDAAQDLLNARYGGNYLGETTLLAAARAKGYATAVLGKFGPVGVQDVTGHDGQGGAIMVDDDTGGSGGIPLPQEIVAAIEAAGLPARPPRRGAAYSGGDWRTPGTKLANVAQQDWFLAVATKVLLPRFKAQGKPFVLVFWSRDPDGSQHSEGDSLNALTPGINGPTSMAGIRNASNDLAALRETVAALGLAGVTDVVTTADHGFSVKSQQSATSASAKFRYPDTVPGFMPTGFLGVDLAQALDLPLWDAAGVAVDPMTGGHPRGGALIGADPKHPDVAIAPDGGTDLIYLRGAEPKTMARRVVEALTREDYTGAIFVRDQLGPIPGALPTSAVNLLGASRTPPPDIAVSFRSFPTGCADPEICGAEVADSGQQQGQGIHGTLSRQDTHNFMAAVGPDFRKGFVDPAPVSNADWAPTLAKILDLDVTPRGKLAGRVMSEALAGGGAPTAAKRLVKRSAPAANGFVTTLDYQQAAGRLYFDAAGAPGRAIGLTR